MRVRNNYVLYVNSMLGEALFGNYKFGIKISNATIGEIYDCSLNELKYNIKLLKNRGYKVYKLKC